MEIINRSFPRWLIALIDLGIVACSVVLAYLLRFNFEIPLWELKPLPYVLGYILFIRLVFFLIARTHAGIVRYSSSKDAVRIFLSATVGSFMLIITNIITYYFITGIFHIPFSIIVIELITTVFALTAFRLVVKLTYLELRNPSKEKTKVLIYGAGESGLITKRALDRDVGTRFKVFAFVDDEFKKAGKTLENTKIFHASRFEELLKTPDLGHVIISIQNIESAKKKEIIETCLNHNIKILNVPPVAKWINGELSFRQIRDIRIEDLLERNVIRLDETKVRKELSGKTILISGAAGSIGSEIARQIGQYPHKKIVLIDQAESELYHLELELKESCRHCNFEIIIGDITKQERMDFIFSRIKPDIVYHAAAYKHVPMMEANVAEAIMTNVGGTRTIADLAVKYDCKKFVMVSTDKAVNPTSVMGASKRIAEMYTQSLNNKSKTRFITTRFGNVLGSNGSVIPLFRKQIEKGGPITITHPEVTRFFMTIPEACQLVLEAGAMGHGGEIFIFDMGSSVKIADLAKKMVKLSQLEIGKDIQIIYTGLRPGEKLYEELLADKENTLPTHHPQIMIAKVREYEKEILNQQIGDLEKLAGKCAESIDIVKQMKSIVPEFKSQNSIFEQLDSESN